MPSALEPRAHKRRLADRNTPVRMLGRPKGLPVSSHALRESRLRNRGRGAEAVLPIRLAMRLSEFLLLIAYSERQLSLHWLPSPFAKQEAPKLEPQSKVCPPAVESMLAHLIREIATLLKDGNELDGNDQ